MLQAREIFKVRVRNQKQTEYIVTIGNHLATEKIFRSKKDAEAYIDEFHWDMIVALIAEMNEILEEKLTSKYKVNTKE